ncbi:MAG: transcription antitermination factor NusB [Fimbriimonadaceae bacterium]
MATRSRRKAREAALRVLYEVEVGQISAVAGLASTLEDAQLAPELADFAAMLVQGVVEYGDELDALLSHLILDYAYDRVAVVDRNVMRIAAYELLHVPTVPPAVTLNEAVEIAKKYSTAESGKFVNGVLGKLLLDTPKAHWTPPCAATEIEETGAAEGPPDVEVVEVNEAEAEKLMKVGGWTLRSERSR